MLSHCSLYFCNFFPLSTADGGIFNDLFIANLLTTVSMKEWLKLFNICGDVNTKTEESNAL